MVSNTVEISGLNDAALLTIDGGFYSLNEGALTATQALVVNGDTLTVAVTTPGAIEATSTAQLSVGGYTTTFTATTGSNADPVSIDRAIASTGGGCSISSQGDDSSLPVLLFVSLALIGLRSRSRQFQPPGKRVQR